MTPVLGIFDSVQAQKDLTQILLGAQVLQTVNVVNYRAMRQRHEISARTILNGRGTGGPAGLGVIVMMPEVKSDSPNVQGPVLDWVFPIVVVEHPDINFTPDVGTLIDAETCSQYVMQLLQHHADDLQGTYRVTQKPMTPDHFWMDLLKGCVAYRLTVELVKAKMIALQRVNPVAITFNAGQCTLASNNAAIIKYTLDGSSPSEDLAGNTSSIIYNGPFLVQTGNVIRAAGYNTPTMNGGPWAYAVAP